MVMPTPMHTQTTTRRHATADFVLHASSNVTTRSGGRVVQDGAPEYEFNDVEDRTFASLMSSMQGAGAAASLLCLAHMMACTAKLFVRSVPTGQCATSTL